MLKPRNNFLPLCFSGGSYVKKPFRVSVFNNLLYCFGVSCI